MVCIKKQAAPLTTALTGRASPQGEAENSGRAKPPPPEGKPVSKAKKFFAENFANPPEKRLQFFFGYGIVYKLLMQTEV